MGRSKLEVCLENHGLHGRLGRVQLEEVLLALRKKLGVSATAVVTSCKPAHIAKLVENITALVGRTVGPGAEGGLVASDSLVPAVSEQPTSPVSCSKSPWYTRPTHRVASSQAATLEVVCPVIAWTLGNVFAPDTSLPSIQSGTVATVMLVRR